MNQKYYTLPLKCSILHIDKVEGGCMKAPASLETISKEYSDETKSSPEPCKSEKAEKLVSLGGSRWTKGDMERVYLDRTAIASVLGLRVAYYSSGQVKSAYTSDGEKISNSRAFDMLSGKPFYDVKAGTFVGLRGKIAIVL